MPWRSKRPCGKPRCPELVDKGYCKAHSPDLERGSSTERLYDGEWRRFREWFLSQPEHAICADCDRALSTDVHHIKKVRDFPELRLVESNCRGLCHECHSKRTARGE